MGLRLCRTKRDKHQQHTETPLTSRGLSSSEMVWYNVEKCDVVWWFHILVFGNHGCCVLCGKEESRLCKVQRSGSVMVWSCVNAMEWETCTSMKASLMLKDACRFWSNKICHPDNVFFSLQILQVLQQCGFVVRVQSKTGTLHCWAVEVVDQARMGGKKCFYLLQHLVSSVPMHWNVM